MISFLILISTFLLGLSIVKFTKLKLYKLELISYAIILGFVFFTWASFLLILILGYKLGIILSLLTCFLIFYTSQTRLKKIKYLKINKKQKIFILLNFGFWILLFSQLFYSHMLQKKPDGLYSGGGSWGDLALHSSYINKFAQQDKFNLVNPVYSTQNTNYPFLINFYSGLLVKYGLDIQSSLIITGLFLSLAGSQLLYFLVFRLSKSHLTSFLSLIIFYFNGGLGFYYFFLDYLNSKQNIISFLFNMRVEYAHLADKHIHWSNIIADYILPQRGFVIGLAIFLLVINLWREYFLSRAKSRDKNKNLLILSSILIGLAPLFHTHTFLTLLGLQIWLSFRNKKYLKIFLLNLILIILLAFPQLFWQLSGTESNHFSKLNYGWMKADVDLTLFWLKNMGLGFIFLTLGNILFAHKFKNKYKFIHALLWPLIILFIICNFITFQPHVYDNMKFMIYAWAITAITAAILLTKIFRKSKILFLIIFIILNLTGLLSVLRESYTSWRIAGNNDLKIAEQIKKLTPAESVFLTSDDHNHLVTMLAGRNIIMGYRGWLWTHGIDYSQTEKDVSTMFQGRDNTKYLLDKYKINYVYISQSEQDKFKANINYYEKNYEKILAEKDINIFKIN